MLKQRVMTAIVLVVVSLGLLFFAPSWLWQLAIVFVAGVAALEWSQFITKEKVGVKFGFVTLVIGLLVLGLIYPNPEVLKLLIVLQLAVVILAVLAYQKSRGEASINQYLSALFGLVFILAFAWSLIWLREEIAPVWLLFSLAVVWIMDSGAYFAGRRFGRHKLASYVSPGKTWEGVVGGLLLVALVSALIGYFVQDPQLPGLVVFVVSASLIAGLSVFGDLFESLLKRQAGLKDSGRILPGHGGVLDRIDSLLLAVPLFWLFWSMV